MKLSYYPGCSLHGSSREYDNSTKAVCDALGIELHELPDWICCGASSGHSLNETLHIALPAQNLKIASQFKDDLLVPCAACYNRLKAARHMMKNDKETKKRMSDILDYEDSNGITILNWIELLKDRVGFENIKERIVVPLDGLKAACYYGCLLVRPQEITCFDNPEHPETMEEIIHILGASTVKWSMKSECCGGSLSLARGEIVQSLVDEIIDSAKEAGAHAIVTLCPLCFENLDMRQAENDFPIFYLTELLGLALGKSEFKSWVKKHFHDAGPLLDSLRLIQ